MDDEDDAIILNCDVSFYRDGELGCDCRHNTEGRDCEKCKPFYLDRPWGRGTSRDPHECKGELIPISLCFFTLL
jgi:hypothetical protein